MNAQQIAVVVTGLALLSLGFILIGVLALHISRRPRGLARPDFDRMAGNIDYYRKALHHIFKAQGYSVAGYSILKEKYEREAFTVLFALRKEGLVYCVLCVRYFPPVTSDVIERFKTAMNNTQANRGMIVTASTFSPAALDHANGLPVALYDRNDIRQWIEDIWPQ